MYNDVQKTYVCGKCGSNWFGPRIDSDMPHWVICPYCGHTFQTY